jgi:hypothetical protein
MRRAGISDEALTAMLVETPRRLLTMPTSDHGSPTAVTRPTIRT